MRPVQRRFAAFQILLKQIEELNSFQHQLETYKENLVDLDKLAVHLQYILPANESTHIIDSLPPVQKRLQNIVTRTHEKMNELEKALQTSKKVNHEFEEKKE